MSAPHLPPSAETDGLASAAAALAGAGLDHWFFGGWAVDLWVGRLTRPHEDIDVLLRRSDEAAAHAVLVAAGWTHRPSPEDIVGTDYERDGEVLQITYAVPGDDDGLVVPVPGQPIVLSTGPLAYDTRPLGDQRVRVLTLEMMLAIKQMPRPDEPGAGKDAADLAALREVDP